MYLTSSTLMPYLMDRGVLSSSDLLDDDMTVLEVGRRNRNFKLLRRDGTGVFIKQIPLMAAETTQSVRREAILYAFADTNAAAAGLKSLMPQLRHYDKDRHLLAVDLVPHSQSLTFYQMQVAAVPGALEAIASQLGSLLAACHAQPTDILTEPATRKEFPANPPWVLSFSEFGESLMPDMSAGARAVLATLRQEPGLKENMTSLRSEWRRTCLIHGDLKWENFLVSQSSDDVDNAKVQLIDWELADLGDAAWDVACVLASFLQPIIVGRYSADGQHLGPATAEDIARAQSCCRAFWQSYTSAFSLTKEQDALAQIRCARFAAARFVLTAYEISQSLAEMPPSSLLAIKSAASIFNDPSAAVRQLFSL